MVSRRSFISSAGAAALAAQLSIRPNFIVISTDDHGYRDLGCQGAADLRTPHFDALAASGVRFTNWCSNNPLCAPSRASLLTGRYPERARLTNNGDELGQDQHTIASLLKPLGYKTGLAGKWHQGYSERSLPNAHGFDYFYGFLSGCVDFYSHRYYWGEPKRPNYHDLWRNGTEIFEDGQYLTERITQESVEFIERAGSDPFFLYIAYNAPHYPMHAPKKYMDRFPGLAPERRTYAAMIAAVDDGVGAIVKALERTDRRRNTMIAFAGDNGATTEARAGLNLQPATAGDNGVFRGFKFSLFDGGIRVPAMMSWPGRIPPKQVNAEIVMTMDLLPTILAAAGGKLPEGYAIDGKSILGVAEGKAKTPHDAIFWRRGGQTAVREGKWKLVLNGILAGRAPEGRKPLAGEDSVWLSNLEDDPGERVNLRREKPEIASRLADRIAVWQKEVEA